MTTETRILVAPRQVLLDANAFTTWHSAVELRERFTQSFTWESRDSAEHSEVLVQPIAAGLVTDDKQRFLVLRRTKGQRADISSRLTLVVGGHIDLLPSLANASFDEILQETLIRELDEELHIQRPERLEPLGVVVDRRTLESSKHIGIVFKVIAKPDIRVGAPEEFLANDGITGTFMRGPKLKPLRRRLDPWSQVLLDHYILKQKGGSRPGPPEWPFGNFPTN